MERLSDSDSIHPLSSQSSSHRTLLDRFSAEHPFDYITTPIFDNTTPLITRVSLSVSLCAICSGFDVTNNLLLITLLIALNIFVWSAKYRNLVIFLPTVPSVHPLSITIHLIEGSSIVRRGLCYDRFLYHVLYTCFFSFSFSFPF
jgi:hypothetical protein